MILLLLGSGAVIGTMNLGKVYELEIVVGVGSYILFRPQIKKSQFGFAFFYVLYLLIHYLLFSEVTANNNVAFFKEILILIVLFLMSLSISRMQFLNSYINIMCIESIYSLIMWLLNIIGIHPFFRIKNFGNLNYFMSGAYIYGFKNLKFPLTSVVMKSGITRNFGIFWEPGAHQGFIVFALLLLIMNQKNIEEYEKKFLILLCTLFSTLSTTGLICAVLIMIMYYIEKSKIHYASKKQLILFVMIIIISYFILTSSAVIVKLTDSSQGSIVVRSNDVISSFSLVMERPIFGYGEYSSYKTELLNEMGVTHNSAGLLIIMLNYGIPFGLYLAYRFIKFIYQSSYHKTILIFLTYIVIIICLLTEHFMSKQLVGFMMFTLLNDAEGSIKSAEIQGG